MLPLGCRAALRRMGCLPRRSRRPCEGSLYRFPAVREPGLWHNIRAGTLVSSKKRERGGSAMAIEWRMKATEFANCNCAYGCPCQVNALPTHGDCRAAVGYAIEDGNFGSAQLGGLRAVVLLSWPGAIHEGNGTMQLIIDERADAGQRD